MLTTLLALLSALLIAVFASGCDPSFTITWQNHTNDPVDVFYNGHFDLSLAPNQTKKVDEIEFDQVTFEARRQDGTVIYSETLTPEELKKRGWTIVIGEPDSS